MSYFFILRCLLAPSFPFIRSLTLRLCLLRSCSLEKSKEEDQLEEKGEDNEKNNSVFNGLTCFGDLIQGLYDLMYESFTLFFYFFLQCLSTIYTDIHILFDSCIVSFRRKPELMTLLPLVVFSLL